MSMFQSKSSIDLNRLLQFLVRDNDGSLLRTDDKLAGGFGTVFKGGSTNNDLLSF